MRCNDHRAKFTQRYDGELSAASLRDLETHIASCDACETEWSNYLKAVEALHATDIAAVPDSYVDEILAATLGQPEQTLPQRVLPTPSSNDSSLRRRSQLSHGAALLLGAALMLLFLRFAPKKWFGGAGTVPTTADDSGGVAHGIPLPPFDRSPDMLSPSTGGSEGHDAVAVSEPPQMQPELPPIEPSVVTRTQYVNRAIFLPIPLPIPAEPVSQRIQRISVRPLAQGLADATASLARFTRALEQNTEQRIAQRRQHAADAAVDVPDLEHVSEPTIVASADTPRRAQQAPSTLAIQRREDQVSLSTMGTLEDVVPALIELIEDDDPEVGELVQLRLQEIWSQRTGTEFLDSPLEPEPEPLDLHDVGWRRFSRRSDSAEEPLSITDQWTTWWANEQVSLASAAF